MVKIFLPLVMLVCNVFPGFGQADRAAYMGEIKTQLKKEWPANRTINFVFHGHSVPAGFFKTPLVNSFDSYPLLFLKDLKKLYPTAVANAIVTAKGGENSIDGAKRFASDVLSHKPDVVFIDYALNDRLIGIEKSAISLTMMIEEALAQNIKVILLTPTPHEGYNFADTTNAYEPFAKLIRSLSTKYKIGLVDSYRVFSEKLKLGEPVTKFLSQVNHPNKEGHQLVADEIIRWFK